MSWRQSPPAYSPVSPSALLSAMRLMARGEWASGESALGALERRNVSGSIVLTDSGTSALVLALNAVVPRGGVVALPGYGCFDLTAAARRAGVRVRLYDLSPASMSPDLDSLRATIGRGVDAIVVTHLHGYPADVPAVEALARPRGIPVIEDAAQGAGGSLRGVRLGELGELAILSFGRGKGITAGSGGAIVGRGAVLRVTLRRMRQEIGAPALGGREFAQLIAQWLLAHEMTYRIPASIPWLRLGEMVYHVAKEPAPMTVAASAILAGALALEERELAQRRDHAATLLDATRRSGRLRAIEPIEDGVPGYLRFAALDQSGDLAPLASIGAVRGYPLTLDQHEELFPILEAGERAGKGSSVLRDRLFTLPTHSRANRADARVDRWLRDRPALAQTAIGRHALEASA